MALRFQAALELAAASEGMDADQVDEFLELLIDGRLSDARGAELLVTLAERGETPREVAAFVRNLRQRSIKVSVDRPCFDVVGTGGSKLSRFNISTTAAFALAAAGVPVAKHGNRGSRRPNGSFDLLERLGIPIEVPDAVLTQLQRELGLCFI
ncbi:MAG: anthranilate phosphoribosyltransferase, partial [Planctomycetota bacterium]